MLNNERSADINDNSFKKTFSCIRPQLSIKLHYLTAITSLTGDQPTWTITYTYRKKISLLYDDMKDVSCFRNLEVKRNPELNLKLLSEISHNTKHTEIDGDLWYGPDFKNEEKHAEIRFEMNRNIKSLMDASADIQTRVRVPELVNNS